MAQETIKGKLIDALKYNLQLITTSTGYNYTMGDIHILPVAINSFKNFPVANIFFESEPVLDNDIHSAGLLFYRQPVNIDFYLNSNQDTLLHREQILSDVEKRLLNNISLPDSSGNGTCSELRLESNLFFGGKINQPIIGFTLALNILYHTSISNQDSMS